MSTESSETCAQQVEFSSEKAEEEHAVRTMCQENAYNQTDTLLDKAGMCKSEKIPSMVDKSSLEADTAMRMQTLQSTQYWNRTEELEEGGVWWRECTKNLGCCRRKNELWDPGG